jgi:hypothetical protein
LADLTMKMPFSPAALTSLVDQLEPAVRINAPRIGVNTGLLPSAWPFAGAAISSPTLQTKFRTIPTAPTNTNGHFAPLWSSWES